MQQKNVMIISPLQPKAPLTPPSIAEFRLCKPEKKIEPDFQKSGGDPVYSYFWIYIEI